MDNYLYILYGMVAFVGLLCVFALSRIQSLREQIMLIDKQRQQEEDRLNHQVERLEQTIRHQNDQQSATLMNTIERSALQMREQVTRDNGIQSEKVSIKMGELQSTLVGRFGQLEIALSERYNQLSERLLAELIVSRDNQNLKIQAFNTALTKELQDDFRIMNETIESRLNAINSKVDERLTDGFKQTNQTFTNIIERLSKIDEAQKKIERLSGDIISLQDVLTDKKNRGIFGEVQLQQILSGVFGSNESIYSMQVTLSNGSIADAVLKTPEPLGTVAIDSKFPLENYRRMTDKKLESSERTTAERLFKQNIRKHISDIATKYIIPNETANQAIMFVPAEAIFAEINAYHGDLVAFANKNRVWLASPTTLMAVLTTVQVMIRNMERDKLATEINEELNKLGIEFRRYQVRWDKLRKTIEKVGSEVKDVHNTTKKITTKFNKLSQADLQTGDLSTEELPE